MNENPPSPITSILAGAALATLAVAVCIFFTSPLDPSPTDLFRIATALATTSIAWKLSTPRQK